MARVRRPKIQRPPGRPTVAQSLVEATLMASGEVIQEWMVRENKIATGRAVNGFKIVITKGPKAKTQALETADKINPGSSRKIKAYENLFVQGKLKGVPYINETLQGRKPGKTPPIFEIRKWMRAKKLTGSAFAIARKIGRDGTNPPFFRLPVRTQMVLFHTRKANKIIGPIFANSTVGDIIGPLLKKLEKADIAVSTTVDSTGGTVRNFQVNINDLTNSLTKKIKGNKTFFEI